MLQYSKTTVVPTDRFKALMRYHQKLYVNYKDLCNLVYIDEAILENLQSLIQKHIAFYTDEWIDKINASNVCYYLEHYENVPNNFLTTKGVNGVHYSLNEENRNNLNQYNYVPEFMDLLNTYFGMKTAMENGRSLLKAFKKTDLINNAGKEIWQAPFSYRESDTYRVYTSNISATTIPLKYIKTITAPKDYYIIWSDFAQIDLRCAWNMLLRYNNKSLTQDEPVEKVDFYRMVAEDISNINNLEFNINQFKKDRPKYKVSMLSTINGASINSIIRDTGDKLFAESLYKYVNEQNKSYKSYKETIYKNIDSCVNFYMQSYFGTKMYMPYKGLDKDICNASLNRPFQGTSADIQKLVTVDIYDRMQSLIQDKAKFFPILNRHDETLWYIHKDCLKYLPQFNDCCEVQIDDWDIVQLEWDIGTEYKVPLTNIAEQFVPEINNKKLFSRHKIELEEPDLQSYPIYFNFYTEKFGDYQIYISSYRDEFLYMDVFKGSPAETFNIYISNLILKIPQNLRYTRIILMGENEGYLMFNKKEIILSKENLNSHFISSARYIANRFVSNVLNLPINLIVDKKDAFNFTHKAKYYNLEGKAWKSES